MAEELVSKGCASILETDVRLWRATKVRALGTWMYFVCPLFACIRRFETSGVVTLACLSGMIVAHLIYCAGDITANRLKNRRNRISDVIARANRTTDEAALTGLAVTLDAIRCGVYDHQTAVLS